jgi:transcriptional regulator with XRE-family HTH domain
MSFGKRLQELRRVAGLSQTDLAKQSGISIDSLRNWEQDRALPKIDAAARLARHLKVLVDELVRDADGTEPLAGDEPKGPASSQGQEAPAPKKTRGRGKK